MPPEAPEWLDASPRETLSTCIYGGLWPYFLFNASLWYKPKNLSHGGGFA